MSTLLDELRRLVTTFVGRRLDHLALYPAIVVQQRADGTLDLTPESDAVPSCQGVPIRYGIPGVTATIAAGARVLLGYAGGDPSRPYASLWESGSVTELKLNASTIKLNNGTIEAARKGHAVNAGTINLVTSSLLGPTAFAVVYVNADGVPGSPQTVTLGGDATVSVPLVAGKITGGESSVRLP